MLPAALAQRGPYGISGLAVIASAIGVAFLGLLDFQAIVEILNVLCESQLVLCPSPTRSMAPTRPR